MKLKAHGWFALAAGTAAVLAIAAAMSMLVIEPAAATAQFATETGKSCGDCHTNAKGGGPLTPFGEKFKANGNKLPK